MPAFIGCEAKTQLLRETDDQTSVSASYEAAWTAAVTRAEYTACFCTSSANHATASAVIGRILTIVLLDLVDEASSSG